MMMMVASKENASQTMSNALSNVRMGEWYLHHVTRVRLFRHLSSTFWTGGEEVGRINTMAEYARRIRVKVTILLAPCGATPQRVGTSHKQDITTWSICINLHMCVRLWSPVWQYARPFAGV